MRSLRQLRHDLTVLETAVAVIKAQDYIPYPAPFVLDTATIKGKVYYRQRPRLADGKPGKPEYIAPQRHAELATALANGRALHRLTKDIQKLMARIHYLSGEADR